MFNLFIFNNRGFASHVHNPNIKFYDERETKQNARLKELFQIRIFQENNSN
jgi:hypothetical protein